MTDSREIDFSKVVAKRQHPSGVSHVVGDPRPKGPDGKLLTAKQIRARARRRADRRSKRGVMTKDEFEALYKPIEDWDMEELARGRPRDVNGGWKGGPPKWVSREVHEQAMERFKTLVKLEMNSMGARALDTFAYLIGNEDEDPRGRPMVPPSVKLQAASFLVEHIVGKPTQRVESDISVKLQGILGVVMANPNDALAPPSHGGQGYELAHLPGHTIPLGVGDSDIQDAEYEEAESE